MKQKSKILQFDEGETGVDCSKESFGSIA